MLSWFIPGSFSPLFGVEWLIVAQRLLVDFAIVIRLPDPSLCFFSLPCADVIDLCGM